MGMGGFRSLIILLSLMIRQTFAENRWSILNIFFSRRCFFIHACLRPASGLPLARLWPFLAMAPQSQKRGNFAVFKNLKWAGNAKRMVDFGLEKR